MGTLFGPEWITQGLLAIGASGAFLALVAFLGDAGRPACDFGYEPVRTSRRAARERRPPAAFPGAAAVVLRANDCLRG